MLYRNIDCGPFDGGCLVFAQALQRLHGGDVFVIEGRRPNSLDDREMPELTAQHAVLRLPDGRFGDADGFGGEQEVVNRFVVNECAFGLRDVRTRPLAAGDLPDAPANESLVAQVAAALRDQMTQKRGYRP